MAIRRTFWRALLPGVYWLPPYAAREDAGPQVGMVNVRQTRKLPERKTLTCRTAVGCHAARARAAARDSVKRKGRARRRLLSLPARHEPVLVRMTPSLRHLRRQAGYIARAPGNPRDKFVVSRQPLRVYVYVAFHWPAGEVHLAHMRKG